MRGQCPKSLASQSGHISSFIFEAHECCLCVACESQVRQALQTFARSSADSCRRVLDAFEPSPLLQHVRQLAKQTATCRADNRVLVVERCENALSWPKQDLMGQCRDCLSLDLANARVGVSKHAGQTLSMLTKEIRWQADEHHANVGSHKGVPMWQPRCQLCRHSDQRPRQWQPCGRGCQGHERRTE